MEDERGFPWRRGSSFERRTRLLDQAPAADRRVDGERLAGEVVDDGPEFVAQAVREWITAVGARTAFIEPGSPWENGSCESFNSKLRDDLLNGSGSTASAKRGSPSRAVASTMIPCALTGASATSRPRLMSSCGREPRPSQPWPPSPPCIRFDPGHLMGAGRDPDQEQGGRHGGAGRLPQWQPIWLSAHEAEMAVPR